MKHGINLAPPSYYGQSYPFIDRFKIAGAWTASNGAAITLSAAGYPAAMPVGASWVYAMVSTDAASPGASAQFVLTYSGTATILIPTATIVSKAPGRIVFNVAPGQPGNHVQICVTALSGLGDMHVVRSDQLDLFAAGEIFQPAYVKALTGFHTLRFMDWNGTNNWIVADTDPIKAVADSWRDRVPIAVQAQLCNETGAHMWLNIPVGASWRYVVKAVKAALEVLKPGLMLYVEIGNELWNYGGGFEKAYAWLTALAAADKITPAQEYGKQAGLMMMIIAMAGYGADRVKVKLCWQPSSTGSNWPLIAKGFFQNGVKPAQIDSYNMACYPDPQAADYAKIIAWAKAGDADSFFAYMSAQVDVCAPWHAAIGKQAKAAGIAYGLYETNPTYLNCEPPIFNGTKDAQGKVVGISDADRATVQAFYNAFAHSDHAVALGLKDQANFEAAGGQVACAFNDFGTGSAYGQSGMLAPDTISPLYPNGARLAAENLIT